MLLNFVPRHESFQLLVTDGFNFIDFVRGPKAVHEMQKWDSRLEGGHLGMSWASWTLNDDSIAKPHPRTSMVSLWSP
jgi:hypothetical protein